MSLRSLIGVLSIGFFIAWATFLGVVFQVNPYTSGWLGITSFYLSAFLVAVSTLLLFGITWRIVIRKRHETTFREVRIAFRHALLLSLFSITLLFLSAQKWLSWLVFGCLLIALGVVEYLLLLIDDSRRV